MQKSRGFLIGIRRLMKDVDGLVTVEWVAVTAFMVIAAAAVGFAVLDNTRNSASKEQPGIANTVTNK
jgi:hypothetical protein